MENAIEILEKNALPALLREIPDPPKRLFIRGKFPGNGKFLCVVGSRKCSRYGADACRSLIAGLRGYDIVIVSGLALGIDCIAHEAALSAGLTAVAVPGSGLAWNTIYPPSNRKLAQRILSAGGALVSEYGNYFKAVSYAFPKRNRIMAGMSHAVLVVEAELKSGTLITSKLATEYNRDVFAVPGSIFSSKLEGPHMLIRLGATPVRRSEDIIAALGFPGDDVENDSLAKSSASLFGGVQVGGLVGGLENAGGRRNAGGRGKPRRSYKNCSATERKILKILEVPMSRPELIRASGFDTTTAIITLSLLEIKGLILESMGEVRLK